MPTVYIARLIRPQAIEELEHQYGEQWPNHLKAEHFQFFELGADQADAEFRAKAIAEVFRTKVTLLYREEGDDSTSLRFLRFFYPAREKS